MSKRLWGVLLGAVLALTASAAPALADTPVSSCGALQSALTSSASGATITLSQGLTCTDTSFTLPSHPITLQGAGTGATFNGGDANTSILTGTDVGATTIRSTRARTVWSPRA